MGKLFVCTTKETHLCNAAQWAKNGKIVQLIMCVQMVARIPQRLKSKFFYTPQASSKLISSKKVDTNY